MTEHRREFLKKGFSLAALGMSNMVTGIGTSALLSGATRSDRDLIARLKEEKGALESQLTAKETKLKEMLTMQNALSAQIIEDESSLNYKKHGLYKRFKGDLEGALDKAINKYARIHPVSKLMMLSIAEVETSIGRNNISYLGAGGIWQFMPETARRMGLNVVKNEQYDRSLAYRKERWLLGEEVQKKYRELERIVRRHKHRDIYQDEATFTSYLAKKDSVNYARYLQLQEDIPKYPFRIRQILQEENENLKRYMKNLRSYYRKLLHAKRRDPEEYAQLLKQDERFDIVKSTDKAVKFVAGLLKKSRGNYVEMLSRYYADDEYDGIKPLNANILHIEKVIRTYLSRKKEMVGASYVSQGWTAPVVETREKEDSPTNPPPFARPAPP